MFTKVVVIDAAGHLLGRLASILAKELLNGQRVVVVRCEEINISGSIFRNKVLYARYLRKRTNTNPTHGPWHYRSPSRQLWRVVRGMIPHKTERGVAALERLKVYEGIPHPFNKLKRVVVPGALRNLRLKPNRKYCKLGDLASQVGWKHQGLIERLENKRKVASKAYYQTKKQLTVLRAKATANVAKALAPVTAALASSGY